ncbi:hypothetical protein JOE63_003450 [Cellulosimicrobium cellulans]|jgi:hypothetical protein|uniref:Uncharacterized protein n=1 Tax=Cellulosimicrobium cellulans TaxID=1710 RepID=A0A1Y0HR37_CELCE|nr:hypothetical protein [Cellulosimicrobium cellulans]ARU50612.1 hypothetical protein CBR64_02970 [Cellulosimicrobium cellulans]MBM7820973.1 hypothetical protein [Cellulosimicrobium cellulans]
MSAYSPTLPRTVEPRGADRLLVVVGSALSDLGRRRAAARAQARGERIAVAPGTAAPATDRLHAATEHTLDRAAVSRASLLP